MTRFKPVPAPPADRSTVADAQRAVPLVPKGEADCCARLLQRVALDGRDEARAWLTFLRALGLVAETDGGFRRTDRDPESEAVPAAFRERVFGAREALSALDDSPRDADGVFDSVRETVPQWERERYPDWEARYRERTAHLLGWAALFGLAARPDGGGYVRA